MAKPNRETGVKIKAPGQHENNSVINVSVWMQHGANSVPRTKGQGQQKQFESPSAGELHHASMAAGQEMLSVRSCPVLGQCPSGSRLSFPSLPLLFRHQPCDCHRFGSVAVIKKKNLKIPQQKNNSGRKGFSQLTTPRLCCITTMIQITVYHFGQLQWQELEAACHTHSQEPRERNV